MKHTDLYLILLLTVFSFISCQKEEIDYYDQTSRINFIYGNSIPYNFCDSDYIKGNEYHTIGVYVQIQGNLLTETKDFVLKACPAPGDTMAAEVILPEKYTFTKIDTTLQQVYVKVKRPARPGKSEDIYRNYLKFDLDNPAHQWDPGRADKDSCRIEVTYELLPTRQFEWDKMTWGDYSDAKYMFMLDHFKVTYSEMPWDGGDIKAAYEKHKQDFGPILDETGKEIMFPEL